MSLVKYIKVYEKEHGIKLLTHEKSILKAIQDGKMTYYNPNGSPVQSVLDAYEEYKNENL